MTELNKDQIIEDLKNTIGKIVFTKVNGDERVMFATLNENMLPKQIDVEEAIQKKKPNPDVLAVYDVKAPGWRSFRWDSLKSFEVSSNL
tara:strand:- start:220 stop:486 length:267 start_codon:yes stop_codon:yes gene_type:complete